LLNQQGFDIFPEVSFLNGEVVPYGTKGSVRADAVVGKPDAPTTIYDLKTGGAKLTNSQVGKYKANAPSSVNNIKKVKPNQ
jgi:hypothetical protein